MVGFMVSCPSILGFKMYSTAHKDRITAIMIPFRFYKYWYLTANLDCASESSSLVLNH